MRPAALAGGPSREAALNTDHPAWWAAAWAAGGAIVAAALHQLGLWLASRLAGKAAVQEAINKGFAELMEARDRENAELRGDNARLRQLLLDRDILHGRQIAQLRGHIMNLTQALQSRDATLRRQGIQIPEAPAITRPLDDIIELPSTVADDEPGR